MREQLTKRLEELKAEYEAGQKLLADLEAKQANLRQTLIRISGAIQVLEEELGNRSRDNGEAAEVTGQTRPSKDDVHGNM